LSYGVFQLQLLPKVGTSVKACFQKPQNLIFKSVNDFSALNNPVGHRRMNVLIIRHFI